MDRGHHPAPAAATAGLPPAASRAGEPREGKPLALDLDRLVWDPEYREAMRPWLSQAGQGDS